MKVKYYYSRPYQVRTNSILTDEHGKYIATLRNDFVCNKPRIVVCSILDGNKMSFGYTVCSPKDQFIKNKGRKIAFARALRRPYKVIDVSPDVKAGTSASVAHEIMHKLLRHV